MQENADPVFALDIGTRKVVGMIAQMRNDTVHILDMEVVEHKTRTILDGQIHNVGEVAKVVCEIKNRLEQRNELSLTHVGVAVAGRSLKTVRRNVSRTVSLSEEISAAVVRNLELEAVSHILRDTSQDFGSGEYYCVGYSVVFYALDGAVVGDLVGHTGQQVEVEVIATFLPRMVLNSMLNVLRRAGLEAVSLTLEPIAAINAIIPDDVRRLNIVLLDIGAGTSDIALTRNGMIVGYGMVPEAGDEITETLCERFILDFNAAEQAKRRLQSEPVLAIQDILGRRYELPSETMKETVRPRVQELAQSIAGCVRELNQGIPHAVVMVGGGSQTPFLAEELAEALPLSAQQIGIRLPDSISDIVDHTGRLQGPEMVTPVGICLMTARSKGLTFIELTVNDRRIHLLDMQQPLDVMGALVAAGVEQNKLYGKIGQALCVEVNGELKVIRGKVGTAAQISVDGQPADLSAPVRHGQTIAFTEASDGEDAQAVVREVVRVEPLSVTLNDKTISLRPRIFMNGFPVSPDEPLCDRACIVSNRFIEVRELLRKNGIEPAVLKEEQLVVRVNRQPRIVRYANFTLQVNGIVAPLDTTVGDGDQVGFSFDVPERPRVKDLIEVPSAPQAVKISLNGQECWVAAPAGKLLMNGKAVHPDDIVLDRAELSTTQAGNIPPMISHALPLLALDPSAYKGKKLQISIDGKPAAFTSPLTENNTVQIEFVDR